MKRLTYLCTWSLAVFTVVIGWVLLPATIVAQAPGDIWVDGYTRKDGTKVKGYWRSSSNRTSSEASTSRIGSTRAVSSTPYVPIGAIHYRYGRSSANAASSVDEITLPGLPMLTECEAVRPLLVGDKLSEEAIRVASGLIGGLSLDVGRPLVHLRASQGERVLKLRVGLMKSEMTAPELAHAYELAVKQPLIETVTLLKKFSAPETPEPSRSACIGLRKKYEKVLSTVEGLIAALEADDSKKIDLASEAANAACCDGIVVDYFIANLRFGPTAVPTPVSSPPSR